MSSSRNSIYGPLIWQRLAAVNQLIEVSNLETDQDRLSLELKNSGVLILRKWQSNESNGFEFRISLTRISEVRCDKETNSIVINGKNEDSVQSLLFSLQEEDWDGDYAYSAGETGCLWIGPFKNVESAADAHQELMLLLKIAQTPAKVFAELPSLWN